MGEIVLEISIFRKINRLPKDKEDKKVLSRFTGNPHLPEVYPSSDLETLVDAITNVGWSPFIFNGVKQQENFVKCDFLVLDIDENLTIDKAYSRVETQDFMTICLPTPSHTAETHRFRMIFPLAFSIDKKQVYKDTMKKLVGIFPEADPACITDTARFYFPCKMSDEHGFIYYGSNFITPEPEKRLTVNLKNLNFEENRKELVELFEWYLENVQKEDYNECGTHIQCPACRLEGKDSHMDNLYVNGEDMRYHCFANPKHNDIIYKSLVEVKTQMEIESYVSKQQKRHGIK